ncbi:polysaccharide deacetylase family protein [Paraclostridium ghonii]|uniref:polysaccharide deacetylase family protein n=1 Tax=Paraclostridium ghonii TaxID=29358 RepID=UPI00202CC47B|nr:polysaccharide deacetylase family protein [Paeniclostridium ghonii]MCM0167423.1 polysaccharide deacetylase family protein [Paeniclostridium ghonii]
MKKILYTIVGIIVILIGYYFISNKKNIEVPILMYHHFDTDEKNINNVTVKKSEFEKQIKYLKENNYTAITVKDLVDFTEDKKVLPKKPILITADDGYKSNYEIMYPILKKYGMKATVFIIGKSIDDANKSPNAIPNFNWEEAKEMYNSGIIDIECHTYNSHERRKKINGERSIFSAPLKNERKGDFKDRITEDINKNISVIQSNLGYKPYGFACPYGEYSRKEEKILKENGIKFTFLASGGKEENIDDRYLLKRIPVNGSDNMIDFEKNLN